MPSESKASGSESKELKSESKSRSGGGDCKADGKDTSSTRDKEEPNALIKSVITFFFEDDAFAQTFETFAQKHCQVFDLEEEEMKLEYTDIYNKFLALFEEKLEDFIESQGATVQQFYELIRQAYERDRESSIVICSEILVATADFDVFVLMMRQTKESMLLAKG